MNNPRDFKIRCSAIAEIMTDGKRPNELSVGAKTYCRNWFLNYRSDEFSKYTAKGNAVENKLIMFAERKLDLFMLDKNDIANENDYMRGTADVVCDDLIIDVKAAWDIKTLADKVDQGLEKKYMYQMQGYMCLYNKPRALVFHGLVDTPAEVNFGKSVYWEHLPEDSRFVIFEVLRDEKIISKIEQRVEMCREYLFAYRDFFESKIGKIVSQENEELLVG